MPIPIRVRVEIAGDEMLIDFEGTSPQVDASVNCPVGMVRAACYCAMRGIVGAEIPNCEGYMTPIRVHAPAGTVVNPVLPAACGARGVIGYRVYDAIMGALAAARARPRDRCRRGWADARSRIGGYDEERRPFGHDGGARRHAGARGRRVTGSKASRTRSPTSATSPSSSSRPTSRCGWSATGSCRTRAAPGASAAGSPTSGSTRCSRSRATLTIRTDRRDHPPYGLDGGEPGAPSANVVVSNGEARELPTMPMEASLLERG